MAPCKPGLRASVVRVVVRAAIAVVLASGAGVRPASAQPDALAAESARLQGAWEQEHWLQQLGLAVVALPLSAALGAALAFRPRRRGTPPRTPAVIQTQIILAIVGAVVMLVVGASLARAFAIVGAASLIRYRSKIEDPKDAGVMLAALGIGLAAGVGLFGLAVFSTLFVLGVLWIVESLEPEAHKRFAVTITSKTEKDLRDRIEGIFRRYRIGYELRSSANGSVCYEVAVPHDRGIDRISDALLDLDGGEEVAVEWDEKKVKVQ